MNYDYLVIVGYFALMVAISVIFKNMASKSTSDYFRGGGKMLWWMVGATAFMTQFSAWTFTGAAGKAFNDGFIILAVFVGNMVAYVCAYLYFARRFRQMRVDTPTEGVRRRFGSTNEQFFTWVIIPLSVINAGVWLNGLGVFASAVFEADIITTIYVTGAAVLIISLLSGAWGVVASDFVQTLVVAVISIACAIVALWKVGGPVNLVTDFPGDNFLMGPNINYPLLVVCSFLFFIVKQLQSINNMQESYRFLNAKDSKNATKAAGMAFCMMLVGAIIWFIPPWATASLIPDAAEAYPQLGNKASDAVYLVFARELMPIGTVGLLMAGLFAATMSSMDSALNRNSGIFVRSFYAPIICKGQANDKKLLRAGQVACLVNGILVILMAQFFNSLKHLSLFDLMMQVATLLQSPILVPLFFGMIVKKTPKWAPWATVIVGMGVSYCVVNYLKPEMVAPWFGIDSVLTGSEKSELRTMITIAAHLFVTAGFFCATSFFYNEAQDPYKEGTDAFFKDVETECIAEDGQDEVDRMQRRKLGVLVTYMAMGLSLMVIIPNEMWGRMLFLGCALTVFIVGFLLKKSAEAPAKVA